MGGSLCSCTDKGRPDISKNVKGKSFQSEKYPKTRGQKFTTVRKSANRELEIRELERPLIANHREERVRVTQPRGELLDRKPSATEVALVEEEIERWLRWMDRFDERLTVDCSIGLMDVAELKLKLRKLKKMKSDLSEKKDFLTSVNQKAKDLLPAHPSSDLERLLITLKTKLRVLHSSINAKSRVLKEMVDEWKDLSSSLQQLRKCLKEQMNAADTFDTIRLLASDVDKQLDRCKFMLDKTTKQTQELSIITTKAESLKLKCNDQSRKQLKAALGKLTRQHEALLLKLKQQKDNLWNWLSSRKKFEEDCHKINRWCRETAIECNKQHVDCSDEALQKLHRHYQNLSNSAHVFDSFVKETTKLGHSYWPSLSAADRPLLKQQIDSLHYNFIRVSQQVKDQLHSLKDILEAHREIQETPVEHGLKSPVDAMKQPVVVASSLDIQLTGHSLKDILEAHREIQETPVEHGLKSPVDAMKQPVVVASSLDIQLTGHSLKDILEAHREIQETPVEHGLKSPVDAMKQPVVVASSLDIQLTGHSLKDAFESRRELQTQAAPSECDMKSPVGSMKQPVVVASSPVIQLAGHPLKVHESVHEDLVASKDTRTTVKALVRQPEDQVYKLPDSMVRVEDLKQQTNTVENKPGVNISDLDDPNKKMEDFEKEVNELMKWVEQTRTRMTMRDTTTELREQLSVQEVCGSC